mmetsp:Transcript_97716/g.146487  ORF Transcript_97716/g.146487 Transcript_97716/m.146487 type:complete len:483 (-) Transcript_97716:110-1558(-)|eukprot:CAMPEP_0117030184 /NCGR_PEP_ID=MMETSP0472-20121206/21790_1 /TAXON_ID=693140 ORGANISM="Tiarina fusus, Strain LIS" /NCGR_SAMPLE_ID=MMETSP0472 /ASSEMBLY_ACC=CAM_ASM_000603 /LENGTH=482 /DNA_ID=CAMNT_0004738151 /DNA_START=58 /DNA_END=1506 /DNA_ORIENTATION=-
MSADKENTDARQVEDETANEGKDKPVEDEKPTPEDKAGENGVGTEGGEKKEEEFVDAKETLEDAHDQKQEEKGDLKEVEETEEAEPEPKMELRIEIRRDDDNENEDEKPADTATEEESPLVPPPTTNKKKRPLVTEEERLLALVQLEETITDPTVLSDLEYIKNTAATSRLEIALSGALRRKESHVDRLTNEIQKLKAFISKRKQTYKRKRKDEGAPTRALSAYNIFVQDRFAELAKENEAALKSADSEAQLKRVPPANLVASTGNQWKELAPEQKSKYEARAKEDRKRYEDQMAQYQPPDKQANRKRNKTGYNMFFSAHVLRLKQSDMGVPSERGSVARLVGTAWKQLSAEEKQYYEREADKHNGMNPVEKDGDDDDDEELKRQQQAADPYAHMHAPHDMHMHGGMPPPMHPGMHQPPQHDPRHHGYAPYPPHHIYGQPPHGYYDYGHHAQGRHQHSRSQGYAQGYPPQQGHPYDQRAMQM